MVTITTREQRRASHWREIESRVRTHEGEFLSGEAGRRYQKKWSKQYLGKDLGSRPEITADRVKQYEKTGK